MRKFGTFFSGHPVYYINFFSVLSPSHFILAPWQGCVLSTIVLVNEYECHCICIFELATSCGPTNQRIRTCRPRLSVAYSYKQLSDRISRLTDCNFTIRMLYCDVYLLFIARPKYCFILMYIYTCGLTVVIKRICYVMLLMLCYFSSITIADTARRRVATTTTGC